MQRIFFYGLFMDRAHLEANGLNPTVLGVAELPKYRIHIGDRATLVPSESGRAYGIVMELSSVEAKALYAEPSVQAYQPEAVSVVMLDGGDRLEVLCYNLPPAEGLVGANPAYAEALAGLSASLGLDAGYVREISAFADEDSS